MRGPYISSELDRGITTITLYEFDQAKTNEALLAVGSRMAHFHGVPGFTYHVQVWNEVGEALKLVGLA